MKTLFEIPKKHKYPKSDFNHDFVCESDKVIFKNNMTKPVWDNSLYESTRDYVPPIDDLSSSNIQNILPCLNDALKKAGKDTLEQERITFFFDYHISRSPYIIVYLIMDNKKYIYCITGPVDYILYGIFTE